MNNYRSILLSGLLFFSGFFLKAQSGFDHPVLRASLDSMFVHLDKTRVPTGYLRDFAQEHVSFDDFNGQLLTDSNYVTPATYAKLLMAANSASVNTSTSVNVGQVLQHLDGGTDFQIGTALFKYDYIVYFSSSDLAGSQ